MSMSPSTPNTTNIRAWVDALRSGRYEQGTGALSREDEEHTQRYCCLGVACEVAIAHGADIERVGDSYNGEGALLPAAAVEWFGLRPGLPAGDPLLCGIGAMIRNDVMHHSFDEIAAAIEREYLA